MTYPIPSDPGTEEGWVWTFHGHKFPVRNIRPEHIYIPDIAYQMASASRFTGCLDVDRYTVGMHSLEVMWWIEKQSKDPLMKLMGLIHDAAEAYVADISTPFKRSGRLGDYTTLCDEIMLAVSRHIGIPDMTDSTMPDIVRRADAVLLNTEAIRFYRVYPPWASTDLEEKEWLFESLAFDTRDQIAEAWLHAYDKLVVECRAKGLLQSEWKFRAL